MHQLKNKPIILYRADGGYPVGMGHIQRALRFARALANIRSVDVLLVAREDDAVVRVVRNSNLPFLSLEMLPCGPQSILPRLEAEPLQPILEDTKPDLVVIDMLDTPADEMAVIADAAPKLACLDDRGPGRREAELIINVLVRDPNPKELKPGAILLEGPAYAPLTDEFASAGARRREMEPPYAENIFVSMGGADASGLLLKVADSLLVVEEIRQVTFAVGPAFTQLRELKEVTKAAPWTAEIAVNAPSLLPLFLRADIAIVAGGFTMHEAACCGVPAIAIVQPVDHQLLVAGWLQDAGAMINLGYGENIEKDTITSAVCQLAGDQERRQEMSRLGKHAVDGRGTPRCAEALADLLPVSL